MLLIGFVAGIIFAFAIAFVIAIGNDRMYLDYPPEEMEWDKREKRM